MQPFVEFKVIYFYRALISVCVCVCVCMCMCVCVCVLVCVFLKYMSCDSCSPTNFKTTIDIDIYFRSKI